ncbi:MAG: amidohydrolase [Acidobacteriota bacterium]|nr:amidohydrolase [Acidobacteriota bacterium]
MSTYTRKEFLNLGAVLAGGAAAARLPIVAAQEPAGEALRADLAVIDAQVYTVDDALPRAEAFAVRGDRFVAVGSTDDVRNLVGPDTEVIDAAGMTVTPGFIDTHSHPSGVNELYGVNTNLRTVAEIQRALRTKALDTPPGRWVRGFMFDDTKVVDGPLHRTHLDEAVPDHPVDVAHRGGHTNWFNSTAFALAGITRDTPDPPDGRFARDADGGLSGMVAEYARDVFADVGEREDLTADEQRARAREGMAHISRLMTAAGLTTVHDAGAGRGRLLAYQDAREAGELRHRVYAMVRGPYERLRDAGVYTGLGDEWVRIGGVKYGADGSASERTMRMSTPFEGRPDDYGILTMSQEDIHEVVEDAHRHNWQVGIHANGDVTIDMVLNAYERVLARWPHPDRRHRIEHCSLVNPELLARIRDTGSIPTPFWTYVHFHGEKWRNYGAAKMEWMFAHRSFLDYGIPVAGASDYTPGPFEPLMAIQSMVTRRDFDGQVWGDNQRVSVDEALRIGTIHGARASYEERDKGSITAGKLADFVVLERDPHDADPDDIKNIGVVRTVVGGRTMHSATA